MLITYLFRTSGGKYMKKSSETERDELILYLILNLEIEIS